jgi:hypothetical protein
LSFLLSLLVPLIAFGSQRRPRVHAPIAVYRAWSHRTRSPCLMLSWWPWGNDSGARSRYPTRREQGGPPRPFGPAPCPVATVSPTARNCAPSVNRPFVLNSAAVTKLRRASARGTLRRWADLDTASEALSHAQEPRGSRHKWGRRPRCRSSVRRSKPGLAVPLVCVLLKHGERSSPCRR